MESQPETLSPSNGAAARSARTPSDPRPYLGTVIAGRYRIDKHVASGTMGRVFEGTQIPLERPVAIKVLKSTGPMADVRFKKRFCREASIAAQLQHHNIVSIYDYGEAETGDLFMVMELLSGRSLLEAMLEDGPFSPERTLNVAMQVTRALRRAHHQGVVHRDLKPANIIVLADDEGTDFVKVLDFGLVKIFAPEDAGVSAPYSEDHLTRVGCMVGTPEYVSPEQALGEAVDGRTDIYSLGVMMFQMVTGKLPFIGTSLIDVVNQHLTRPVPRMAECAPYAECPLDLERIIRKCMGKLPDERYASMDELLTELKLLWRVMMDESCGTEPSLPMLEFEMRPRPTGLRPETIALAPISHDPPPPAALEEETDGELLDPSEAIDPGPRAVTRRILAVAKRSSHRLKVAVAVLLVAMTGGAFYCLSVQERVSSSSVEIEQPLPAEGDEPSVHSADRIEPPSVDDAPRSGPRAAGKKAHLPRKKRGYKENPF